jgi:hypothetical protein
MARINSLARGMICLLLLGITALIVLSAETVGATPASQTEIPDSYELVAENEQFQLYVNEDTLAFKLLDMRSDYLWHSGVDEPLEEDRLNRSWLAFAQSGVSIEYLDNKAVNKRTSITNSNMALAVSPIEGGIAAQMTFQDFGISLRMVLQLQADGVRIELPFESIREENPDFRLSQIYLYPFLGATRGGSIPGYMLLPDGTGSLIRFADSTKADNILTQRYYGPDLGILALMPFDPRITNPVSVSLPVFGMVHDDQHAFLSIVEKGSAYGEVQAHPAGIITNFNFLYNAFIYNEPYFQATNLSGAGVTTVQRQSNAFDAVIHYRFLTGDDANVVGMARNYQQFLLENGSLRRADDPNPNIGIRLEFLGGEKEQVLLWDRFIPMTTLRQMGDILTSLQMPNAEVIYYGWQPYGASSMPPTSLTLEGGLGGMDELRTVAETITANGGHFSLYLDPQAALYEESGYSARTDLAMAITSTNVLGFNRMVNYYFSFGAMQPRYAALVNDISAQAQQVGLALDGIGSMLYSDFREGSPLSREASIDAYRSMLAETPMPLGFYRPNAYMFGLMRAYYDMPLGDNGYIFTSEPVPFLPMVLAGYVPYYGTALNFSSNRQDDLLRHVEYGMYPSYFLTHEPTANIMNTLSYWIYSSSYDQWGEEIRRTYEWMNALLAPVRGQAIIAHEQLADRVFATTYSNGRQIVVNYTDRPFEHGGTTIEPKNAALIEISGE